MFGAVKLTKNADPDRYKSTRYGIGFDLRWEFLLFDGSMVISFIILSVNISSSVHIDNKIKDILILGEGSQRNY